MIKDDDMIVVRNRNNGSTGYTLDNNFHREFAYQEVKKIPFEELKRLSYAPGGRFLLDNYLVVENEEALDILNMKVEPEYFYDEKKIREMLFAYDNIDEFADFLDFAPNGCLEIAKTIAINEKIPDVRKRDMLGERLGVNITNAIMVNEIMNEDDEKPAGDEKQRRVPVEKEETQTQAAPTRRTAPPQHKVVSVTK